MESAERPLVLLVEDDPALRGLLDLLFEDTGIPVEPIADGHRAIERLVYGRPLLVVLDLDLPNVDGAGVAAELRARYGDAVPIVVISALPGARRAAHEMGAAACFAKPFDPEELVETVRALASESAYSPAS